MRGDRSNTEFAEFLGMSRQTVGFYINGERIPDILGLRQIAEKCTVSADWLLGLSDIRTADISVRQVCTYTGLSQEAVAALKAVSAIEMSKFWEDHVDPELHVYPSGGMSLLFSSPAFYDAVHSISKALSFKYSAWTDDEKTNGSERADRFKLRINASKLGMAAVDASDATNFYIDEATRKMREAIIELVETVISEIFFISVLIKSELKSEDKKLSRILCFH